MNPSVFDYHDYREFFKDWLAHARASLPKFSITKFAEACDLSESVLSMYINGGREITLESIKKIAKGMKLGRSELKYLELLWTISESSDRSEKVKALANLSKYQVYKKKGHNEERIYKYLSKWLHVAVRELVLDREFKEDAKWIQQRLRFNVSLVDIRNSLTFLIDNDFLSRGADGRLKQNDRQLECHGEIYKLALAQFHTQMFDLTVRSISEVESKDRQILGHTAMIPHKTFLQLKEQLSQTIERFASTIEASEGSDVGDVYHISLSAIPLTEGIGIKGQGVKQ